MKYAIIYFSGVITGCLACYLWLIPAPKVVNAEPVVVEYEKPVPYEVIKPVFVDKWHIVTRYDTIFKIDTVQVVEDYFTAKTLL